LALGHAWFKLDLPKSRFDGAITMEYSKGPLVINGQIDIGAKFGKYWFVHGRANANFLQFFTANGLIVFAENWDFFYRGDHHLLRVCHSHRQFHYIRLSISNSISCFQLKTQLAGRN
ncbi:hypothetical protein JYU19_02345, partial [bacterium AH-315-J21]|nr:hypothetical protein [bacterium AH-315-J21]